MNLGEALMQDRIPQIIPGNPDPDPPCLSASVRGERIEQAVGQEAGFTMTMNSSRPGYPF